MQPVCSSNAYFPGAASLRGPMPAIRRRLIPERRQSHAEQAVQEPHEQLAREPPAGVYTYNFDMQTARYAGVIMPAGPRA